MDPINDDVRHELATVKRLITAVLVVLVLVAALWWFTAAQDKSEGQADELVECLLDGGTTETC